jgi:hypothetical protein
MKRRRDAAFKPESVAASSDQRKENRRVCRIIGVVAQKARSPDGDRASLAMDGLTARDADQ